MKNGKLYLSVNVRDIYILRFGHNEHTKLIHFHTKDYIRLIKNTLENEICLSAKITKLLWLCYNIQNEGSIEILLWA